MRKEKPLVGQRVIDYFNTKAKDAIHQIKASTIPYIEAGFIGSYARNEYLATSDIDIVVVLPDDFELSAEASKLRDSLDDVDVDIVYVHKSYFDESQSNFARRMHEDYIKVLEGNNEKRD